MDIARLMAYVQQVEEEKVRDREEFRNKKAKTGNESGQQRSNVEEEKVRDREEFRNKKAKTGNESGQQRSNVNRSFFQQNQKGLAPSSSSALTPRNKCEYNSQNSQHFRARLAQS
ncbi:hypothetical protein H5410_055790 [Solanum commersonii]|uniref:Gag-pol polyprotein n=1 Tax=Solanum commersonii TaxID=4109 RepID=A0A9J5WKU7_SOLCO|nr:hypothetical protein H5410_055790 [Solanum commersonii]